MKRNIAISMAAGLGLATVAGTAFSAGLPTAGAPALTGVQVAQAMEGTKHITGKVTKIDVEGRTMELGNAMGATDTFVIRSLPGNDLATVKVGDDIELAYVEAAGRKEVISWNLRDADQKPVAPGAEPARAN